MATYLTSELHESIKGRQTSMGCKLDDVIRPGVEVPDLRVGLVAGDEECYTAFLELFKDVTEDIQGPLPKGYQVSSAFDPAVVDASLLVDGATVTSVVVSLTRNISGFPLPSRIKRKERQKLMERVLLAIESIQEELGQGKFSELAEIEGDGAMEEKGLLPGPGEDKSMMRKSGISRDWPHGRGIFEIESQVVWINEEDHLKFICRAERGDLKVAIAQVLRLSEHVEKYLNSVGLQYMYHPKFGFLSSSPLNIGTGLRLKASVVLKGFRYTAKNKKMVNDELDLDIAKDKQLESEGRHFQLSNRRTMYPDVSSQVQAFVRAVGQLLGSGQEESLAVDTEDDEVKMAEHYVPSQTEVYLGDTEEGEYYEDFNDEEPKEVGLPDDHEGQDVSDAKPEEQEKQQLNTDGDQWYETKEDDGGAPAGSLQVLAEATKQELDLEHIRGVIAKEMSLRLVDDSIKLLYHTEVEVEQQPALGSPAF